tara:strand:- start:1280 stop:1408 length:129 start_codon:yes stop_codon:yes gene_type:complete
MIAFAVGFVSALAFVLLAITVYILGSDYQKQVNREEEWDWID